MKKLITLSCLIASIILPVAAHAASAASVSTTSLHFGGVRVGTTSAPLSVFLTSTGPDPLAISTIIFGSAAFSQTSNCPFAPATLQAGSSCRIDVRFSPVNPSTLSTAMTIAHNAPSSISNVTVTGNGLQPEISITPTSLDFGNVPVATASAPKGVTVTNTGNTTLTIFVNSSSAEFRFSPAGCGSMPKFIQPGEACTFTVTFTPSTFGGRTGLITIGNDAPDGPHQLRVSGTGKDVIAPSSMFSTAPGAIVISPLQSLSGSTTDDLRGVDSVTITYTPLVGPSTTSVATLTCNAPRTACTWTAPAPLIPGPYTARAQGRDRESPQNVESPGPQVAITVV